MQVLNVSQFFLFKKIYIWLYIVIYCHVITRQTLPLLRKRYIFWSLYFQQKITKKKVYLIITISFFLSIPTTRYISNHSVLTINYFSFLELVLKLCTYKVWLSCFRIQRGWTGHWGCG